MKKLVMCLLGTFLVLVLSVHSFAEETIRLSTGPWDPYTSEHLKHNGVGLRIVTEAFAVSQIKVQYEFFPWARAYDVAKYGDVDGSAVWEKLPDRQKDFFFSKAVFSVKAVFFHLRSFKFDWKEWIDLKGIDIGSTIGYADTKLLEEKQKIGKYFLETVPSDEISFRKLLGGRVQLVGLNIMSGYAVLQKYFPKRAQLVTHHPKIFRPANTLHFVVSKLNKKRAMYLINAFNKGLMQLKNSGKYDQYFAESRRGEYIITK